MLPAILAGAGAIAGSMPDKSKGGIDAGSATALENQASQVIGTNLSQLQNFVGAGAGQNEVAGGLAASNNLASMLEQYAKGGFLPGEQDFATANKFASQAFQPQQIALQQNFQSQQQRAAQLAAQLGRPVNDPIIQAKLSQEYMQGQERLGAAQGAYASEFALQLPQQRLGYTSQLADVKNSLASQAMANRQALLALGSQVQGQERQFRLQTGTQWQESGGGLKGAITGGIAGLGAGLGAQGMMARNDFTSALAQGFGQQAGAQAAAFAAPAQARRMGAQPMAAPPMQQSLSATPAYNIPMTLNPNYGTPSAIQGNSLNFGAFGQMSYGSPFQYGPGYGTIDMNPANLRF